MISVSNNNLQQRSFAPYPLTRVLAKPTQATYNVYIRGGKSH